MPTCPTCQQSIDPQAITCPYCRTSLKAFGHPGIPLHRSTGAEYLCDSCVYHHDDSCNFPKRPLAKECTLYVDRTAKPLGGVNRSPQPLQTWVRRHSTWLLLAGLFLICLILAMRRV